MSKDNSFPSHLQLVSVLHVRASPKDGATVAFADVKIGPVTVLGVSIVKNRSGGFFVGLPVRFGKTGKAFALVEIDEPQRSDVFRIVLAAASEYTQD